MSWEDYLLLIAQLVSGKTDILLARRAPRSREIDPVCSDLSNAFSPLLAGFLSVVTHLLFGLLLMK